MDDMKILVTGFDPFGDEAMNSSYESVKLLPDKIVGADVIKLEVPTVFGVCAKKLYKAIVEEKPDVIICVGQAGGRSAISVEKVAINLKEARIPDNKGRQPSNMKIKEDGETAYFANVPVKAMADAVKVMNLPASVSYTAGTYVSNELMYSLMYFINKEFPDIRGGFIQVPYDTSQVVEKPLGIASMPVEITAKALKAAIEAAVLYDEDIDAIAGTLY